MAETSIRNLSGEASTLNDNAYLVVADTDNNTKKIKGSVIKAEATAAASAVAPSVAVLTGTITHGAQIPLPAGFTEAECKWIVSVRTGTLNVKVTDNGWGSFSRYTEIETCHAPAGRVASITSYGGGAMTGTYMIIGVK